MQKRITNNAACGVSEGSDQAVPTVHCVSA